MIVAWELAGNSQQACEQMILDESTLEVAEVNEKGPPMKFTSDATTHLRIGYM